MSKEISREVFLKRATMGLGSLGLLMTGFLGHSKVDENIPETVSEDRNVILLETHLAGAYFYDAINYGQAMKEGQKLLLKREPHNPHDSNAIEIYWENIKVGYVPRRHNSVLALLMDQGVTINARISQIEADEPEWQTVFFEASMMGNVGSGLPQGDALSLSKWLRGAEV